MKNKEEKKNFRYKKHLGQNFLHNQATLKHMIEKVDPKPEDSFIEIGPGSGNLTKHLVESAGRVLAIELDPEAIVLLKEKIGDNPKFVVINADFMEVDLKSLIAEHRLLDDNNKKIKVIGNIPYYITTPIIEKLIQNRSLVSKVYLTMQKEVADRIVAKEGSKIYGSLSVFCQFYADCKMVLKLAAGNFFPVPDVDSAFIELDFEKKEAVIVKNEEFFFKVMHAGFGQRRKMFMSNLKRELKLDETVLKDAFKASGIDEKARAETVPVLGFAKLSDLLYNQQ
jgi:16S rRNA (adenine1518-N6/adenine1519-N6)-dimethyltransferase